MNQKLARPSDSYYLSLPKDVLEDYDDGISSYWIKNSPALLQLSSYVRHAGPQVAALDRLAGRVAKQKQGWHVWESKIYLGPLVDQATAEYVDENGTLWIHSYIVWPHLTIYATVSGPETEIKCEGSWPLEAIKSLRVVVD
jgi:hypothetical protein